MLDKSFNETTLPIPMIFASCLPLQVGNFYPNTLGKVLCWGRCWSTKQDNFFFNRNKNVLVKTKEIIYYDGLSFSIAIKHHEFEL